MNLCKAINAMIKKHLPVDVNWLRAKTRSEIEVSRHALMEAGYKLDTRGITPGHEHEFQKPSNWLPQETWYPPEEKA